MSSQHSDDQTARSRPLPARQSRCRSPFTRAGSLPASHSTPIPIGHEWLTTAPSLTTRTPFKKGEGCAAASGRLARPAETPLEKALRAAGPPLCFGRPNSVPPPRNRLRRRSRSSPRRRRLFSPARHKITHTARPRSCSGPAPCRPCPGQEPAPRRVELALNASRPPGMEDNPSTILRRGLVRVSNAQIPNSL
jgi:hypothetical protein